MIRSAILSENEPLLNGAPLLPVRLRPWDRPAIEAHLLALGPEDRRLRFGTAVADEAVRDYVRRIEFATDAVFALHDDALRIVAAVHVACGGGPAELGLSVLATWREHGCGNALFERAVTFLRNRGVGEVFVHCLAENGAMMYMARKHGMRVAQDDGESDAHLLLPSPTAATFVAEWLGDHQAQALRATRQALRNTRTLFGLPQPTG